MSESVITREVVVNNRLGIHARPADLFVKVARQYQASVTIVKGNERVDGKSILDLLTLAASSGTRLVLEARGEDAAAALEALAQLVAQGFGEELAE